MDDDKESEKPEGRKLAKGGRGEKAPKLKKKAGSATVEDFVLASHRITNIFAGGDFLSRRGLSLAEWAVLKAIGGRANVQPSEIGKAVCVSKKELIETLQGLEHKGFITHTEKTESDRRTVSSTPIGTNLLGAVSRDFDNLDLKLLAGHEKGAKRIAASVRLSNRMRKSVLNQAEAE